MGLYNEIIIRLGLPLENCIGGDRVSVYDGKGVFIEGHGGISCYTDTEIVVRFKRLSLTISGAKLKIIEMNDTEIYISGDIKSLTRG